MLPSVLKKFLSSLNRILTFFHIIFNNFIKFDKYLVWFFWLILYETNYRILLESGYLFEGVILWQKLITTWITC